MKPIVKMEIPEYDKLNMGHVTEYLNQILERYGPPCDWCENFDVICEKGLRPREYELAIGPFERWTIRKHCEQFKGRSDDEAENDAEARAIRNRLSCDAQTYGG